MLNDQKPIVRILDYTILVFFLIFLFSLSNSIFVNQLGYFGTLIFILIRYTITRENQFQKTGIEIALLLYILAEILSTIFSDYASHSFNNLLKRALLIPVVYTVIAAVTDMEKGKLFFKVYIAGTIVTVLIYLYFSFDFFINNLYGITQSGPSLFQYPITASEIMSFTVIFLFAFMVNEKTDIKTKIFLFAGLLISSLALIATYKRTGWIGAAFGILIILILRKQWKTIAVGVILFIVLLQFEKNISELIVFDVSDKKVEMLYKIETQGRATEVFEFGDYQLLSDYENGISIYDDSNIVKNISTPSPAISFSHLKENIFLANLVDARFFILEKAGLDFSLVNEIIPPGFTVDYKAENGFLYVLDSDSGLTIYTLENSVVSEINYPEFAGYKYLFVDSSKVFLSSVDSGLVVYKLVNNLLDEKIFREKRKNLEYLYHDKNILLASCPDGITYYKTELSNLVELGKINSINRIRHIITSENGFLVIHGNGDAGKLNLSDNDSLTIGNKFELGFIPNSATYINDKLYVTNVKRSRLLSIFDPYIPSNFNRIALWRAGILIFIDHPLFGVGDIDLAQYYRQYKRPYDKEIHGHMHNNFIHFLVTLGLFGLLVMFYLFIKMINIDLKIYKEVKDKPFLSSLALGTLASFCGILAAGLTELNFWDHEIQTLIWFTFGLNYALYLLSKKESVL